MMNLRTQLLALTMTEGIGLVTRTRLLHFIISGNLPTQYPWSLETITRLAEPQQCMRIAQSYDKALDRASTFQLPYLSYFDEAYPEALREIHQPPLILFYEGNLDALKLPSLSVVGTRLATPYGLETIRHLLPTVISKGISIVSGLAQGIDVMAHQITFAACGVPIGVIGTGLDVVYPNRHAALQKQIANSGLLISEYPADSKPLRSHFPERNRIIAGLSSATLVIEAKKRSGNLITANLALQNNRDVLAVPGSIFSETAQGTNELLSLGAKLVVQPEDILESVQLLNTI